MNRLIISTIFFVVVLVFGLGFVLPKYQNLKIFQANIKDKNIALEYKKEYSSQLEKISQDLENYKENLSKVSSALPNNPLLPSLFNFLQKTSSEAGLILEDITLGEVTSREDQQLREITANLAVSGTYLSFKNFLSTIEKNVRLIEIKNISFSSPQEPEDPLYFELSIKTHSY